MGLFSRKKDTDTNKQKTQSAKKKEKAKDESAAPVLGETAEAKGGSRLVIHPLLTEKAVALEAERKYVFVVDERANKKEVQKEIERLFGVKVEKVNMIRKKEKQRMWRGIRGKGPRLKKAIVTIEKGKRLEVVPT